MRHESPITQLIAAWPKRQALADEIGVSVDAVHKWARSGRIPSDWQDAVVKAARARGIEFATAEWMLAAHARNDLSAPKEGAA
ncbi:carph-isopro domain-containing protein [Cereibacter azotoformans]|uniref:carph-isopro domain-containing protein n=1 Tax=Cereibacter azotoformans TaxID=43057 RepID=UPI003B20F69A